MKSVRYSVAMCLDGYIAGPNDESDWILMDADIGFTSLMSRFDTIVMGRRTFEATSAYGGGGGGMPGVKVVVFSSTLRQEDYPKVTIVGGPVEEVIPRLRSEPGKDIWLFGGGVLFRSMLDVGMVDTVEVAVIPVLLGAGRQLLPSPGDRARLQLQGSKVYEKTGTVLLEYVVDK